jgi:hypothetical protein
MMAYMGQNILRIDKQKKNVCVTAKPPFLFLQAPQTGCSGTRS